MLKYSRKTVYDACKRFDETGEDQRVAHNSRRSRILTPHFLAGLMINVDAAFNKRNDRCIASSFSEVQHKTTKKVSNEENQTSSLTSSTTRKTSMLSSSTKKQYSGWKIRLVATSLFSKKLGSSQYSEELRPSNFPDLILLDHYFWARIKANACDKPHSSKTTLRQTSRRLWVH